VGGRGPLALAKLRHWHLVQEPFRGRFALHAVVRHAVRHIKGSRSNGARDARRIFEHYVALLENDPTRLDLEQTHLFAAMDFANASSDLDGALRIERLLSKLGGSDAS
jgi:hypothetical protein